MTERDRFTAMMTKSADLKRRIATELAASVIAVVDACEASIRAGGKLIFCGNGGSAADSQHLATELLIRLRGAVERDSWPALALTLDPAMLTACGNDYGYDRVFERPLRGLGRRGDVLFGITTSGRSPNVVRALAAARIFCRPCQGSETPHLPASPDTMLLLGVLVRSYASCLMPR